MPRHELDLERLFAEAGLKERVAAAQAMDPDALMLGVEFAAHESVSPGEIDVDSLGAKRDCTRGVEASQHHDTMRARLEGR